MAMTSPAAMLMVLLHASPVPVSLEVARPLQSRLDVSVLEARVVEEGFSLVPQASARVRLVVAPHARGVEVMAFAGERRFSRIVDAPADVWPVEQTFELSQRVAALAHEAAANLDEPVAASNERPVAAAPAPPGEVATHLDSHGSKLPALGVVLRPGVLARAGGVDFSLQALGVLHLGRLEPALAVGLVLAPGQGGMAYEFPLLGGVRVAFAPDEAWRLSPEVLLGLRVHWFSGPDAVVRGDPALQLGVSARRKLGDRVALGLNAGAFISTARTHLLGSEILWERGVVGLVAGAEIEF